VIKAIALTKVTVSYLRTVAIPTSLRDRSPMTLIALNKSETV